MTQSVDEFAPIISRAMNSLGKVIKGKETALKDAFTCLIADGHLLIEDIPGVGKTTLAYALAQIAGGSFTRIQFTNDLLPTDILGVSIYEQGSGAFVFHPGPIFANFVLADEINRTTPKTQSSLLECMERSQISIEGTSHDLPQPFMVIATQNPLDFEGTYPLPENQLDRFMMRISMGYPSHEVEKSILENPNHHYDSIDIEPVLTLEDVQRMRTISNQIFVESSVLDYMMLWITKTRESSAFRLGMSTRGAIALKKASQAKALIDGRGFVTPEDVDASILTVGAHRILPAENWQREDRNQVVNVLKEIGSKITKP
jgi:MoxR-like ATPase